jgi:predicted Zn finger-like uncharacterized protein
MKYITSCPKCDTHFLLNDELIKAHRGKVQCGECEHVFNAKTRLTEVADDITSAEQYHAIIEESERIAAEDFSFDPKSLSDAESNQSADHYLGELSPNADIDTDPNISIDTAPIVDDFINNHRKQKKPRTRSNRIFLAIFSFLLLVTALLQTTYHLRTRIAAEYPQFKPLLIKACAPFNCTIGLPKDLDLITIGDSDMQEDDNYQSVINFSSALKNNANYPQTYPNIELTLTNSNNQVVIKKIISPKNYLNAKHQIQNGLAPNTEEMIKLQLFANDADVAGYRILLLY